MGAVLIVLSLILFAVLTKPDREKTGWLIVFFLTNLLFTGAARSDRNEMLQIALAAVFCALVIRSTQGHGRAGVVLTSVVLFCLGIQHPLWLILELIPIRFLRAYTPDMSRKGRNAGTIAILAGTAASWIVRRRIDRLVVTHSEREIAARETLRSFLTSGSIRWSFLQFRVNNIDALHSARSLAGQGDGNGTAAVLFYAECVILFCIWVYSLVRAADDGRIFATGMLLPFGILVYEGSVLMYGTAQLQAVLLPVTVVYTLFIVQYGSTFAKLANEGVLAVLVLVPILRGGF